MLLVAEQLNRDHIARLSRQDENAILSRVHRPPANCQSFFLVKPAPGDRLWFVNQLDAMLVARQFNIPTMNGYSGWYPPDWHLEEIDGSYFWNVRQWATSHRQTRGVCGLDLNARSWWAYDLTATPYVLGSTVDFRSNGNGTQYEAEGWSGEEALGSWMVGRESALELSLSEIPKSDLLLTIQAHAFLSRLRPRLEESVIVNGREMARWTIREALVQKEIVLPKLLFASRKIRVEFIDHDPKSPQELGLWADPRKLEASVWSS